MPRETFPLLRRRTIHAGVANTLYAGRFINPDSTTNRPEDGTPYNFAGYTFECEVRTLPGSGGTKLADATVTVVDNDLKITVDVAQSNAIVAGAPNRTAYADLLGAATGEEPRKLIALTLPTSGTVTIWGEEAP